MAANATSPRYAKRADVEIAQIDEGTCVRVVGTIDEHFPGFGDLGQPATVVIDVSGITFVSSFGVRQWLRAMAGVPASARHTYFVGCTQIFVDQLNMILNFGGRGQVLSMNAPFRCSGCNDESDQLLDITVHGDNLARGLIPQIPCAKCGARLDLDESPDSYFACLSKYGARDVVPEAGRLVAVDKKLFKKQQFAPTGATGSAAGGGAKVPVSVRAPASRLPWVLAVLFLAALAAGIYLLLRPA